MSKILLSSIIFICLLLNTVFVYAEIANTLKGIPATIAFEYFVEKPNHLMICNGLLWTFSEHDQSVIAIDTKSGKVRHSFSFDSSITKEYPIDAAALACQASKMLILINSKSGSRILQLAVNNESIKAVNQFDVPEKKRATDLFCTSQKCWLMQDNAFETSDLKIWNKINIPSPSELKLINARPELDPFEDWQSDLIIAKDNYTKVTANKKNQVVFLDPFRQQVALENTEQNKIIWNKWGKFGGWEGSFLAPKALTFIDDELLAIADAKLKAISIFTRNGEYLGVLTLKEQIPYTPDYPLGLVAEGKRIFISDFSSNKVVALDVEKYNTNLKTTDNLLIRKNLFRRPEVMKDPPSLVCMNCHDGSVSNQLFKYIKTHFHHPLECSQCHDPHHNSKELHNLRKPESQLCQSCHKDYAQPQTNHVWDNSSKKGGKCIDCHKSHSDSEKLLIEKKPELCMNCHKAVSMGHASVKLITDIDTQKQELTQNGELTCQTCHKTHINFKDKHFIKPPTEVLILCSSCHGDKSPILFKEFHKSFSTKKRAK